MDACRLHYRMDPSDWKAYRGRVCQGEARGWGGGGEVGGGGGREEGER